METDDSSATDNIKQMIGSEFDNDNLEVIIFAGGTKTWSKGIEDVCKGAKLNNDNGNNVVYRVHPGDGIDSTTLEPLFGISLDNADISTPECMAGAINWIYDNYDAEHYSMIMWDHGGGINKDSCVNGVTGKGFSVKNLCQGFKSSNLYKAGKKFDFLGMDECLMGSLDIAMVLAPYADYYIGSEEFESGEGWNYSFYKELSELPSSRVNVYKKIVDDYVYDRRAASEDEQLMAVMDLSKASAVYTSYEKLMDSLCKYCDNDNTGAWYRKIQKIRANVTDFGRKDEAESFYDIVDVKQFLLKLKAEGICVNEISDFLNILDTMVIYHDSNKAEKGLIGLGIYVPFYTKTTDEEGNIIAEFYNKYMDWHIFPNYENFLKKYMSKLENADTILLADLLENVHVEIEEKNGNTSYYLVATIKDLETFKASLYSISIGTVCHERDSNGEGTDLVTEEVKVKDYVDKITDNTLKVEITELYENSFEGQIVNLKNDGTYNTFRAHVDDSKYEICYNDKTLYGFYDIENKGWMDDAGYDYSYIGNHYIQAGQSKVIYDENTEISYIKTYYDSEKMLFSNKAKIVQNSYGADYLGFVFILDSKSAHIFKDEEDFDMEFCTKFTDECKVNPVKYEVLSDAYLKDPVLKDMLTKAPSLGKPESSPMKIDLTFKNAYYLYKFLERRSYLNTCTWNQFVDNSGETSQSLNNYPRIIISLDDDKYLSVDEDNLKATVLYSALPDYYLPKITIGEDNYILPVSRANCSISIILSDSDSDTGYGASISVVDYKVTGITYKNETYDVDEDGNASDFINKIKEEDEDRTINELSIYKDDNTRCDIGLTQDSWDFSFDQINIRDDNRIGYSVYLSDNKEQSFTIVKFDAYNISVTGPSKLLTFGLFNRFSGNSSSDAASSASSGDSSDAATSASSGASSDTASSASSGSSSGKTGASVEDSSSGASSSAGAEASNGKETKTLSNIASTGSDIETPQLKSDAA